MNSKIEVGQCYVYHDQVYMVTDVLRKGHLYVIEHTLHKTIHCVFSDFLREDCRRAFQNFG